MNVPRPPTPGPPEPLPTRFNRTWFRAHYISFQEQTLAVRLIAVVFFMSTLIFLLQSSIKFLGGIFYYYSEYAKAALRHDVLLEPCVRIMKEVYPWRNLEREEYWRYMRCTGNEDGFQRQGKLVPTPGGVVGWLLNPYWFFSWVVGNSREFLVLGMHANLRQNIVLYFLVSYMWRPVRRSVRPALSPTKPETDGIS